MKIGALFRAMQHMRALLHFLVKWLRWPAIVIVALNIENLAIALGWDKILAKSSGTIVSDILAIIKSGWFQFPAVFVTGLWLALWFESRVKASQGSQIASSELLPQPQANNQPYDPWINPETETFLNVSIDIESWKAEAIEQNNIYKFYVRLMDEQRGHIEATILFDRFIPAPTLSITCDNKRPGYKNAIQGSSDRHVSCEIVGVQFPCSIRFEIK